MLYALIKTYKFDNINNKIEYFFIKYIFLFLQVLKMRIMS